MSQSLAKITVKVDLSMITITRNNVMALVPPTNQLRELLELKFDALKRWPVMRRVRDDLVRMIVRSIPGNKKVRVNLPSPQLGLTDYAEVGKDTLLECTQLPGWLDVRYNCLAMYKAVVQPADPDAILLFVDYISKQERRKLEQEEREIREFERQQFESKRMETTRQIAVIEIIQEIIRKEQG